jgi:hypothetical protein
MADQFQLGMAPQVDKIGLAAGEIIVQAQDLMSLEEQVIHQMGADEPGPAGDKDAGHNLVASLDLNPIYCNAARPLGKFPIDSSGYFSENSGKKPIDRSLWNTPE